MGRCEAQGAERYFNPFPDGGVEEQGDWVSKGRIMVAGIGNGTWAGYLAGMGWERGGRGMVSCWESGACVFRKRRTALWAWSMAHIYIYIYITIPSVEVFVCVCGM